MPQPGSTILCPTITRHSNTVILMSFRNSCAVRHWGQMSWCLYFHFPSLSGVKLCYTGFFGTPFCLVVGSLYLERSPQSVNTNMNIINFNLFLYRTCSQTLCYASPPGYILPSISDSWWQSRHLRATAKAQMSMFLYIYICMCICMCVCIYTYTFIKKSCAKSFWDLRQKVLGEPLLVLMQFLLNYLLYLFK